MLKKRLIGTALAAGLVAASAVLPQAGPAEAATATSSILVTATVLSTCTVTASPLAFGNYLGVQLDASTTLVVNCNPGTAYTVALGPGNGSGATAAARQMQGLSGATLTYALYQDASRTTVWGDTTGANTLAGTGGLVPTTVTVYGRIPAQAVPSGAYTDTVAVTLAY